MMINKNITEKEIDFPSKMILFLSDHFFSLEEPCISNVSREAIESFRYFGATIAAFDIVVGTIGNLMTILAFYRCRALHTPYNVFIVNLSVIDLVTASLMMPFNLTGYLKKEWPFGADHFRNRF